MRRAYLLAGMGLLWSSSVLAGTLADYTGANGNWNVPANWSGGVVPINSGGSTYDVTMSGKTVGYNLAGSGSVDTLLLNNSTLNLNSGCSLTVLNGLTQTKSNVAAQNAAFSVGGAVAMTGGTLSASAGGSIAMPGLTTFGTANGSGTVQVDWATSSINLSNLSALSLDHNGFTARAQNGGNLALNALTSITGTGNIFESATFVSNGATSTMHANGLAALTMNGASISLNAENGGYSEMTSLATVNNSGSIFGNFNANATGPQSKVWLPALTTIQMNGANNTLQASSGGVVDLPAFATLTDTGNTFEKMNIKASGAGSKVNVPLLGGVLSRVGATVENGGTINWNAPTGLLSSAVTINGVGTVDLSAVANINSTSFTVSNGANLSLALPTTYATNLTDGATQAANAGSKLIFPGLTSVSNPGGSIFGSYNITASGAGAMVSYPSLTTMTVNGQGDAITASGGGIVDLSKLVNLNNSGSIFDKFEFKISDSGSTVIAPMMGTTPLSRVNVSLKGGSMIWGNPTVLKAGSVTIDMMGGIALAQLTNIDSTSFNAANGATITLPNVMAISSVAGTGATLQSSGVNSTLSLPAVETIGNPGDVFSGVTVLASGSGSKTLLPALKAVTTGGASMEFRASSGGQVLADGLKTASSTGSIFGNFNVKAEGANSKVSLSGLKTMNMWTASNTITATGGGVVDLSGLSVVTQTGSIFESFKVNSSGAGSKVNLASMRDTLWFPDEMTASNYGEIDLGGLSGDYVLNFLAAFGSSSTGELDIYQDDVLKHTIPAGNQGNYMSYHIPLVGLPDGSTIRFVADGAGTSVTIKDYVVPEPSAMVWLAAGAVALIRRAKRVR